jgi:hypothetical protein
VIDLIDVVSLAGARARANEDAFGRAGARVWTIDGATGLGDPIVSPTSDAAWLSARASEMFARHAGLDDTRAMIAAAAADLESAFLRERTRAPQARWEIPCGSFMMLTDRGAAGVELAWIGDCRCILRDVDGAVRGFGADPDSEAKEAAVARQVVGADPVARYRQPQALAMLRAGRALYNTPGHGAILAPEAAFAPHVKIATATPARPATALVMTDGFAALELRYRDIDAPAFAAAAREEGLARLGSRLRAIEEERDPDGVIFPRWKRSDDATAALIALS